MCKEKNCCNGAIGVCSCLSLDLDDLELFDILDDDSEFFDNDEEEDYV
jgi:hypothetical protein